MVEGGRRNKKERKKLVDGNVWQRNMARNERTLTLACLLAPHTIAWRVLYASAMALRILSYIHSRCVGGVGGGWVSQQTDWRLLAAR